VTQCPSPVYGPGTNLDGRFWIRSDTPAGTNASPVSSPSDVGSFAPPNTGHRIIGTSPSSLDVELSNHYFLYKPDGFWIRFESKPWIPIIWIPESVYARINLPRPPWKVEGWQGLEGEDGYLVPMPGEHWGLLGQGATATVLDDALGTNLKALLATPGLVWTSAVEPWPAVSRSRAEDGFFALAFAADGTDVVDGIMRQGAFWGSRFDFTMPAVARPGSPLPRKAFRAVFSRSEDRAFVVGGEDIATSAALRDIWMRPIETQGEWHQIELGDFEVGKVLAATWSYADHRLWVLDETGTGPGRKARLYRVEPYLGVVQTVAQWPALPTFDAHWLVLDRGGQVLLVLSSTVLRVHGIVRFETTVDEPAAPIRMSFEVRPKALGLEPFADAAGYAFVVKGPGGKLLLQRRTGLALEACALPKPKLVPCLRSKLGQVH